MNEIVHALNRDYGGDWFYNIETKLYEDFESDNIFMPEDVSL